MQSAIQRVFAVAAAAAIILILTAGVPAPGQAPGGPWRWVKMAPFPEPAEELYGVSANGKMFVMGGFAGMGKTMGIVWEYDPGADKWTKKKDMALPVHHQAMAEYSGKIYVFGGFRLYSLPDGQPGGWQPVDNAWEYDPVADSWKALAPMPSKRGSAITKEVGGKIYVIGGGVVEGNEPAISYAGRVAHSVGTNEAYDPATNKWETRSPMPTPRNHAFSGVVGGKIYVIGGRLGHSFVSVANNTDIVEEYDPATNSWGFTRARMPTPRSGGGSAVYGGKIYVAGGEVWTAQMQGVFKALEAYDPATDTWSILPAMPIPRHGVASAFLGNRLHLVSGNIGSGFAPDVHLSTGSHDVFEVSEK